jgi:hypothetical protein
MSIEYRYDRAKQLLRATMTGAPSLARFEEAIEAITNSDEFPPDVRTLWDLCDLEFASVDRALEEGLIALRRRYPARRKARIAFIVRDQLGVGMTRMYQILSNDETTRVFTDRAAAERWLVGG